MKPSFIFLLLLLSVSGAVLGDNILKNGDFSETGEPMKHWQFAAPKRSFFVCEYKTEGWVQIESTTPESSGFLVQPAVVKQNRKYSLKITYRLLKGRSLFWALGLQENYRPVNSFKHTKYKSSFSGNPLVPDFVRRELVIGGEEGNEWRTEEMEFTTEQAEDVARVRISAGLYFSPGIIQIKKIELTEKPE